MWTFCHMLPVEDTVLSAQFARSQSGNQPRLLGRCERGWIKSRCRRMVGFSKLQYVGMAQEVVDHLLKKKKDTCFALKHD